MAGAAATLRFRSRPPQGPALKRVRLPLGVTFLSALLHIGFAVVFLLGATLWQARQPKTYFVNLVPAVAAVGIPQGRTAPPSLPPRPVETTAPEPKASPAELPERREPPRAATKEMPPRPDRASLPERSLPPASTRLPRPGEKELPAVASPAPSPTPAAPKAVAEARPEPAAPPPPPAPLGRPSGSAQGAGPMTLEVSDFPFAWYLSRVQAKITERWSDKALPGKQPVAVFEIGRDGQISKLTIEKPSGNPYYDQKALRAITDAAPFPPLPEGFPGSVLRIHLGFNFAPDRG